MAWFALLLVATVRAAPVLDIPAPTEPAVAESQIKSWLADQTRIRKRVAASRLRETDLRDALAAKRSGGPARVDLSDQRALMERLPGMKEAPFASCRTLEGCAELPSTFHVKKPEMVRDATAALLRPWVLLQNARGQGLELKPSRPGRDELLRFSLQGLPGPDMSIRLFPTPDGGFSVHLAGRPDPDALYASERFSALASARR